MLYGGSGVTGWGVGLLEPATKREREKMTLLRILHRPCMAHHCHPHCLQHTQRTSTSHMSTHSGALTQSHSYCLSHLRLQDKSIYALAVSQRHTKAPTSWKCLTLKTRTVPHSPSCLNVPSTLTGESPVNAYATPNPLHGLHTCPVGC